MDVQHQNLAVLRARKRTNKHCAVHEVQWVPGPVWTGPENLASPPPLPLDFETQTVQTTGSLYRQRYLVNISLSLG